MTAGERAFCDTNVLLSAVDRKRPLNRQALHVLNELPNRGVELCISGQIVREYLVVSTRPVAVNGLGQSARHALENVEAILARSTLLEETLEVSDGLRALVKRLRCTGKQVHDANVVATMLGHRVRHLITGNLADFHRFEGIELLDLAEVGAAD